MTIAPRSRVDGAVFVSDLRERGSERSRMNRDI
jgi:hypothetical protein